jgi:hypothetical protein
MATKAGKAVGKVSKGTRGTATQKAVSGKAIKVVKGSSKNQAAKRVAKGKSAGMPSQMGRSQAKGRSKGASSVRTPSRIAARAALLCTASRLGRPRPLVWLLRTVRATSTCTFPTRRRR